MVKLLDYKFYNNNINIPHQGRIDRVGPLNIVGPAGRPVE